MINCENMIVEKFLQCLRFGMVKNLLWGDVLDFGGNRGELKKYVKGSYTLVNYDHSAMENKFFDTIIALAVIEHLYVDEVYKIFEKFKEVVKKNGRIVITTPTRIAKPVLDFMAWLGLIDKNNIVEHKHYWNKKDIKKLAKAIGISIVEYKKFQLGFNQLVILKK